MDWFAAVDMYCERTGPEFWAEPVNALSNAAFLIAAAVMAGRLRGRPGMGAGWLMVGLLAAIGVGSFLFHTHANLLAGVMDAAPIGLFMLVYVFVTSRDFLGLRGPVATLVAAGVVPYAAALGPVFAALPFFAVSAFYWPVPLLILIYAAILRRRAPATARGLAIGAGILVVSLTFRSLDMTLCEATGGLGTHFLWHILNGVMLGWMIEVWRRHRLAAA
jgi:hypothetical protein